MAHHDRGDLIVLKDSAALAEEAARRFVTIARESIDSGGRFSVALSGGSTPRLMHQLLAKPPFRDQVDWEKIHVFWGDERFVPPDDPESTYLMAQETLLASVPIPSQNIYIVPTVGVTPEQAAQEYAKTLIAFSGSESPRLDLILLGMGPDGHTASLFPGFPQLQSTDDDLVVVVHDSPKPPPTRLTFTYQVINNAANIIFLVAGADKASTLQSVFNGPVDPTKLPVQGVRPTNGKLVWLVDEKAGQGLKE